MPSDMSSVYGEIPTTPSIFSEASILVVVYLRLPCSGENNRLGSPSQSGGCAISSVTRQRRVYNNSRLILWSPYFSIVINVVVTTGKQQHHYHHHHHHPSSLSPSSCIITYYHHVKALVGWVTSKKVNQSPTQTKLYNPPPPLNGGIFRSRPDVRVDVSPTRGSNFWGPGESIYQIL